MKHIVSHVFVYFEEGVNSVMRNFIISNIETGDCSSVYAHAETGRVKRINWTDEPDGLTFADAHEAIVAFLSAVPS